MGITEEVARLVFQLGIILLGAKLGGELCERFLRQPAVLGELVMGVLLGPFALGGVPLPGIGPLFPLPELAQGGHFPVPISMELYFVAQLGVVILLFMVGLETDLSMFMRYGPTAAAVAMGGVILPFAFGVVATVFMGFATGMTDPGALFMGAIMTATSVGITARVLSDIHSLDTAEGVTILAAAVIDDVLGILTLTVVASIAATGAISPGEIAMTALRVIGIWLTLTGGGLLLSRPISRFLLSFRAAGASLGLALTLAFFAAALAESFGLAMIIGAYSLGLVLSATAAAHELSRSITGVYHVLGPVFFVVIGMMVNVGAMGAALAFGVVVALLAIVSKVAGCGLPAWGFGFNRLGAIRVGVGMVPRGEVGLIIAGIGLTRGIIGDEVFGVAVMMVLITTLTAPPILVQLFKGGQSGTRSRLRTRTEEGEVR